MVGGKSNPNQFFVFAFDDGDLGAGSDGFEPQELSDRECDDDVWQTFDRDACDDHITDSLTRSWLRADRNAAEPGGQFEQRFRPSAVRSLECVPVPLIRIPPPGDRIGW